LSRPERILFSADGSCSKTYAFVFEQRLPSSGKEAIIDRHFYKRPFIEASFSISK